MTCLHSSKPGLKACKLARILQALFCQSQGTNAPTRLTFPNSPNRTIDQQRTPCVASLVNFDARTCRALQVFGSPRVLLALLLSFVTPKKVRRKHTCKQSHIASKGPATQQLTNHTGSMREPCAPSGLACIEEHLSSYAQAVAVYSFATRGNKDADDDQSM